MGALWEVLCFCTAFEMFSRSKRCNNRWPSLANKVRCETLRPYPHLTILWKNRNKESFSTLYSPTAKVRKKCIFEFFFFRFMLVQVWNAAYGKQSLLLFYWIIEAFQSYLIKQWPGTRMRRWMDRFCWAACSDFGSLGLLPTDIMAIMAIGNFVRDWYCCRSRVAISWPNKVNWIWIKANACACFGWVFDKHSSSDIEISFIILYGSQTYSRSSWLLLVPPGMAIKKIIHG